MAGNDDLDEVLNAHGYGAPLWTPDARTLYGARVSHYTRWLASRGVEIPEADYGALWEWSVSQPGKFWDSLWDFFEVLGDRGDGPALADATMPGARWFPGATLNYARNALRAAEAAPDIPALIAYSERGRTDSLSFRQLASEVARVAAGLRGLGVAKGDRVAAFLPNTPQAVVALLATASIGAIWSSCSPDFGTRSVVDRFAQIDPKVLIAVDGYTYNGKYFDRTETVREIAAGLPNLKAVITPDKWDALGYDNSKKMERVNGTAGGSGEMTLEFEEVPFDHPLWVVYSSGTTGLPKPIMHGHGGIVLEHLKALVLGLDLGPGARFTWYTTTGWMMWNFLAGGLLAGVTTVLYDGSATYPETGRLWELAESERLTYLGVGAPYLMACHKAGLKPGQEHDLSALRGIGSVMTSSPTFPVTG